MKNTDKNQNKNNNLIVGFILIGIFTLLLLIISGVFGKSGEVVKNFFLGTFGLSFYGITVAGLLIGILLLFRFKYQIRLGKLFEILGIYALFILAFHAAGDDVFARSSSYGEYIANCYFAASTAGGVLGAIIMYPLFKVNKVFAIVVVAILLFGLIALAMFGGKVKASGVRTRSVKYGKKAKTEVEDPDLVVIDNSLKNEDIEGNELKDIKTRSRFSKAAVDYTPIEEDEDISDSEFKIEYKDKYAFDSNAKDNASTILYGDKKTTDDQDDDVEVSKFEQMRNDAKVARERLYGNPNKLEVEKDNAPTTDKEKFRDAIERIRNNEDTSYLDKITSNTDDYKLYSIEERQRIYKENLEREKRIKENENIDDDVIKNEESEEKDIVNEDLDFNIDDIKIDDDDNSSYNFASLDACTSEEDSDSSEVSENEIVSHDDIDKIIADNVVEDEDDVPFDIDDEHKEEIEAKQDEEEIPDKGVYYDIDDFSDTLSQSFDLRDHKKVIPKKEEPKKEEIKKDEDKSSRVNEIEKELLDEDVEEERTRKRRSDYGGTHISQNSGVDKSKDIKEEKVETPKFINPFEIEKKEEPKKEIPVPVIEEPKPLLSPKGYKYHMPPLSLLHDYPFKEELDEDIEHQFKLIETNLAGFNITAQVVGITKGPTFTRIELKMEMGTGKSVKLLRDKGSDIEMWLGTPGHVNILAPIPGKTTIGIDLPNRNRRTVGLKEVLNSPEYNNKKFVAPFALGVDLENKSHVCDLVKSPHMLIAGGTGSGKSVGINALLVSILYHASPEDVKLVLIDPKKVELNDYRELPHMIFKNSIYEPQQVVNVLKWLVDEMERRYTELCEYHVNEISKYNQKVVEEGKPKMPTIIVVIDEVADLLQSDCKKEIEDNIARLTAKSRAAGIHLILATQRPTADILNGKIKSNLPSRVGFATTSIQDSMTIVGGLGCEKLLRLGDLLYKGPESDLLYRIQGAFIDKDEVVAVTDYIREHNKSVFDTDLQSQIEKVEDSSEDSFEDSHASKPKGTQVDEKFIEALEALIGEDTVSISKLQRKLGLGYPRAGKIFDQLTKYGFLKDNKILINQEQFDKMFGEDEE